MDNGWVIKHMEKEFINIFKGWDIKDPGNMIYNMVKVLNIGKMGLPSKGIFIKVIKSMVNFNGRMAHHILDSLNKVN